MTQESAKKTRGTQIKEIKSIMDGSYANMVKDENNSKMAGGTIGFIGGAILGALFQQNAIMAGVIGGIIGYVVTNKK
jgi:hypothetical protein